jgi:hypothetical protein
MTTNQFLAEWALRSSILIVSGALLLRGLCVKDASIRLAAWVGILCGSLLLPVLTPILPAIPITHELLTISAPERREIRSLTAQPDALIHSYDPAPTPAAPVVRRARDFASFRWQRAALSLYFLGTGVLLMRLLGGLLLTRRLSLASRATGRTIEGIKIRESDRVTTPVALGVTRPVILLPDDWRLWERAKLEVVLAHECSHVRRKDPLVQLLSAIHRAMLWFSPLSWFLHQRIVRVAEEASDDAAIAFTHDRASYAEVLLEFVQRAARVADWRALDPQSVAMARHGRMDARISRILDSTSLSRGLTRWSLLAILVLGVPLTVVVAASQAPVAPVAPASPVAPPTPAAPQSPPAPTSPQAPLAPAAPSAFERITSVDGSAVQTRTASRAGDSIRRYMIVSGDSMTGSWDSDYPSQYTELRKKYGPKFVWFSKGGNDYVVTDAGVLEELHEAMAPQNEVNRMQGEVNRLQDTVNQHQADVNRAQGEVNAIQDRANRRQNLINELQNAQGNDDLIRKLEDALAQLRPNRSEVGDQESANREQGKVNAMQERVNQEQSKVNEQQGKVNRAQEKVSEQLQGRVEAILESALRRHVARQIE